MANEPLGEGDVAGGLWFRTESNHQHLKKGQVGSILSQMQHVLMKSHVKPRKKGESGGKVFALVISRTEGDDSWYVKG